MFETISNWWDGVKAWFKRSESIFLARIAAISGFVTSAIGFMDWSPLWSLLQTGTEFTKHQLIGMGIALVGGGVMLEIARRRGTREVQGQLIPVNAKLKK